ncbi:MAG TPA: thioredoxin domain-containing protein, partial [Stellaceae bacterium]|nr:thioredoxin domain-containing protein [Stellaceae bacterium]
FLTPEQLPFYGGTYFPPDPRPGMPAWTQVLHAIAEAWDERREEIRAGGEDLRERLSGGALLTPSAQPIDQGILDAVVMRLKESFDARDGGFGRAPKFPQASVIELLLLRGEHTMALDTLRAMASGGIHDQIGGGFARYSVDATWTVPHFEKMLYDNALLIELLTSAWQETKSPLYEARVAETIQWVEREMEVKGGGFASSLDADSEHEEGKFYVWSAAEIDALLGPRAPRFKDIYDVTPDGNWEGKTILNRLHHLAMEDGAIEEELASCRAILLQARAARVRPGCDDKVLADWNGLMSAALASAGMAFARPDWIARAAAAFAFIRNNLTESDGRLAHAWREGKRAHRAMLDDYANMSRAALLLHEATGDAVYLAQARRWVAICDTHYRDPRGGYFFTADDAEALLVRTKQAVDQPNPSGNGTLVEVLARLHYLTGEDIFRQRADEVLAAFAGEAQRNLFGLATLLNGAELLARALQIVVVGARDAADTKALLAAVDGACLPTRVLSVIDGAASLPPSHPASGKGALGGRATAYLCEGTVCSLPLTDAAALAAALAAR